MEHLVERFREAEVGEDSPIEVAEEVEVVATSKGEETLRCGSISSDC